MLGQEPTITGVVRVKQLAREAASIHFNESLSSKLRAFETSLRVDIQIGHVSKRDICAAVHELEDKGFSKSYLTGRILAIMRGVGRCQ
jgi:hypothetical protein